MKINDLGKVKPPTVRFSDLYIGEAFRVTSKQTSFVCIKTSVSTYIYHVPGTSEAYQWFIGDTIDSDYVITKLDAELTIRG